ncbi:hypothetical protein BC628DRAFT_1409582 [Trametes gibbosa]|nr:hypothetical protein BC628DRAFT_1409582 [Trametes gibbosa]
MDMSSPPAIAAMMRTCRTLYRDATGPRLLLRNGATLASSDACCSFSAFMFAGVPAGARFTYLRALTVSYGCFSEGATRALFGILVHSDLALESLTLHDTEDVLNSRAHIIDDNDGPDDNDQPSTATASPLLVAFSSLTTLRHLTMSHIGSAGSSLLSSLRSPLVSASLAFDAPDANWTPGGPDAQNPIVCLARAADTLEELSGTGFNIAPDVVRYAITYPRLRHLSARYSPALDGAMPATAAYAHAFPALTHLALCAGASAAPAALDPFAVRALRTTRRTNRDDQLAYGTWRDLRAVEGTVADVYALGLACRVPELRLRGAVCGPDLAEGWLAAVLADVRPAALALTVVVRGALLGGRERRVLARVFRGAGAQGVRALEMQLLLVPQGADALGRVLESVFCAVRRLPLRRLTLTFNYALLVGSAAHLTVYYLKEANLEHYACRFREAMPGLEEVAVRLTDRLADADRWLEDAVRPSGSPTDVGSESGEEEVMQQLAELGFGVTYGEEAW